MSTFLWQIQEIPSVFSLFSLFSVDSGDQKIKTFCTFFGFSAFRPQIGATYITWNWVTIIGQTKNNHGREAAAFLKGRLLELGNNWELQINNNNYGREAAAFLKATNNNNNYYGREAAVFL